MKKDVAESLTKYLVSQKVKVEHQHLVGLLNPLTISEWKWEVILFYLITRFPSTKRRRDSMMVVMDIPGKEAHFL